MGRAPHAEVYERTDPAPICEFFSRRRHIANSGGEIVPCIGQITLVQVINAMWVPEGRTQPKQAIIAQCEAAVSRTAVKEVVAGRSRKLRADEGVTLPPKGLEPLRIRSLYGYNLLRGKPLGLYLPISGLVAVKS